ncbi:MAG: 2-C-methyl-D-erythritol 4-phosphate cytidylyltransferase, partial [Lachnospiraceae bacterium]|nr:2-C-methyl-D-erythritol 4-phosphate cytidylyltransferase [Lachnospiraceae bacterium]
MEKIRTTAIVLAAGQGKRMNSAVQKQYLLIDQKPVLYYSLKAFEESIIDDIVLVTGNAEIEFCQKEIVEKYGIGKVRIVTAGGKERYHSVACGISAISWKCDYVFIHDGARPFVSRDIIERVFRNVQETSACVVGMPVKDTIKLADQSGYVESTPDRSLVWQIQTPQVFEKKLIATAYEKLISEEKSLKEANISITDDAMAVEYFMHI